MLHSSHRSRRMAARATAQKPRPLPRVVRVGRAANDNTRQPKLRLGFWVVGLVLALAALALLDGWLR